VRIYKLFHPLSYIQYKYWTLLPKDITNSYVCHDMHYMDSIVGAKAVLEIRQVLHMSGTNVLIHSKTNHF
jgi:hypothetical protein